MSKRCTFRTVLSVILVTLFPLVGRGNVLPIKTVNLTDTTRTQKQDDKEEVKKEKPQEKKQPDKPIIKEVPKARKQVRPKVIGKPAVKIKPIKVIRPKIKKP